MKRRELVAASSCVVVAGCSGRDDEFRIPQIDVVNRLPEEVRIAVRIRWDGTNVFERADRFSAAVYEDGNEDTPVEVDGRRWAVEEVVTAPVSVGYRIREGDWESVTVERGADECLIPNVDVEPEFRPTSTGVGFEYTCRPPGDSPEPRNETASLRERSLLRD